jgi:hypothetical protein
MTQRIRRWFDRRHGASRRDVFVLRTETGWQVHGRRGGSDWPELIYYFDSEEEARTMALWMSGGLSKLR